MNPNLMHTTYRSIISMLIILVILLSGSIGCNQATQGDANGDADSGNTATEGETLSMEEAENHAMDFITNYLTRPGQNAEFQSIVSEYGLYKVALRLDGQAIESYMTKDGALFFPNAMNIQSIKDQKAEQDRIRAEQQEPAPKSEKPVVKAFVMSHCPYGTQILKGLLPVAKTLGDAIDFQVRFVDYAMHGEKELQEQLRQHCIENTATDQFFPYLECFLEDGDAERCIETLGIDADAINSCVEQTDTELKITEMFKDPEKADWKGRFPPFPLNAAECEEYGVKGSPTLVINGKVISSEQRDPNALLKKVCEAFETAPEACNTELDTEAPKPGFGSTK